MKKRFLSLLLAGTVIFAFPVFAKDGRVSVIVAVKEGVSPGSAAEFVEKRFPGAEIQYTYDTLLEGFSVELSESQAAMLGTLDFIEDYAEVGTYSALSAFQESDGSSLSEMTRVSYEMVGVDAARENGLDGTGTIVAVIDSGFDVGHNAFSGEPGQIKLSKSYLSSIVAEHRLSASRFGITVDEIYKSDRIPFAYDYAEGDSDVSSDSTHGTHVAGIIGAEKTSENGVEGMAPKCQLLLMKIFDENSATSDSILLAALEDAVKLGADVINLSLGRYSGSASRQMISGINDIFSRAEEYGCMIVCAAGNESASTSRSYRGIGSAADELTSDADGLPPAYYTDYGTVSYPASADYTLSVGSVDGPAVWGEYFAFAGSKIYYSDTNRTAKTLNSTFALRFKGTYRFEVVPGVGRDEDYAGLNVKDKLVLVGRGETTFVEKCDTAASHGAVGVIVYNNVENESINLELTGAKIPAVSISKSDGDMMKSSRQRSVRFDPDYKVTTSEEGAGRVSSFSSVGATPSLTLAPDICGVGGGVYSTLPGGYGGLSGTSMAAPQISGAVALISQSLGGSVFPKERVKLIKEILMNTAVPAIQENGVEYSPRSQGAGLVDLSGAADRGLSLTYAVNGKAKAELSDLLGNLFFVDITVKNLTDSELPVSLSATITSDGYRVGANGKYYSTLTAEADRVSRVTSGTDENLNLYADDHSPLCFNLAAGEKKTVTLTFAIDESVDKELSDIFMNGHFIEGYIFAAAGGRRYSLPYMGYSGDWTSAPILDAARSSGDEVFGGTYVGTDVSGILLEAGVNFFADGRGDKVIAFSPDRNGAADTLWLRTEFLRNITGGSLSVLDSAGNEVFTTGLYTYKPKSEGTKQQLGLILGWDGSDGFNHSYILPDGEYTLNYTFKLDFLDKEQTLSVKAVLDTKKPELREVKYDPETRHLTVSVSDENRLQYVKFTDSGKDNFRIIETTNDSEYTAVFDLSEFDGDRFYIEAVDGAYNPLVESFRLSELGGAS